MSTKALVKRVARVAAAAAVMIGAMSFGAATPASAALPTHQFTICNYRNNFNPYAIFDTFSTASVRYNTCQTFYIGMNGVQQFSVVTWSPPNGNGSSKLQYWDFSAQGLGVSVNQQGGTAFWW